MLDKLFLKDKNGVLVLEPETGRELQRLLAYKDETQQCLLLLESDGVLLTLTGPVQKYKGDAEDYTQSPQKQRAQDETNRRKLYEGRELIAWNVADGSELWRFQDEKIDPSKIAVNSGRVYLYANRSYAACLNLKTGAQVWKTSAPISEPKGPGMGFVSGHATVKTLSMYRNGAIATKDVYLINYLPHRHCQAFATGNGSLLWDKNARTDWHRSQSNRQRDRGQQMFNDPIVMGNSIFERHQLAEAQRGVRSAYRKPAEKWTSVRIRRLRPLHRSRLRPAGSARMARSKTLTAKSMCSA